MNNFYPTIYHRELASGANAPILVTAVNNDGDKCDLIIKLLESERMDNLAFLKESIGSSIARKLGICSPEPFIVEINNEFVESQRGNDVYLRLKRSIGINYGSRYILGLELITKEDKLSSKSYLDALKIFCFDAIIQNSDRTFILGKANLFTKGTDLWVLDHELAFTFLMTLIGIKKQDPWHVDVDLAKKHVLYHKLKGKRLNFGQLAGFMNDITEEYWAGLKNLLPDDWYSNEFDEIKAHVSSIKNREGEFLEQIKAVLK